MKGDWHFFSSISYNNSSNGSSYSNDNNSDVGSSSNNSNGSSNDNTNDIGSSNGNSRNSSNKNDLSTILIDHLSSLRRARRKKNHPARLF